MKVWKGFKFLRDIKHTVWHLWPAVIISLKWCTEFKKGLPKCRECVPQKENDSIKTQDNCVSLWSDTGHKRIYVFELAFDFNISISCDDTKA